VADVALRYDDWFERPWGSFAFQVELAALRRAIGDLRGLRVLDVGCGTGRFTTALAREARDVVGVDLDLKMLRVAATRTAGPLAVADASDLPFSTGAFDVVIAVTVCEFVCDVATVVSEMVRVATGDGRVVVASLNARSPWGIARHRHLREAAWDSARFLSRSELRSLGATMGRRFRLDAALFAPGIAPRWSWLGSIPEVIGRHLCPGAGAFQVLVIRDPEHGRHASGVREGFVASDGDLK